MFLQDNPFVTSGTYMYVSLTKSLFKSAGITVSHFFSMLPYALKYLYSVGPVGTHFPAKQPCTNDTVCICTRLFHGKMHSDWFNGIEILQGRWQHGEKVGYCYPSGLEKTLCKWDIHICPAGHRRVKHPSIETSLKSCATAFFLLLLEHGRWPGDIHGWQYILSAP